MTAEEYYIQKYGQDTYDYSQYDCSASDMVLFAEEYYQAKLSEITEDMVNDVVSGIAVDDEYEEWAKECAKTAIELFILKLKGDG